MRITGLFSEMRMLMIMTRWQIVSLLVCFITAGLCYGQIINGELDQWADGKPVGWEVGQEVDASADMAMRISGTSAIRMAPRRTQTDLSTSSSISQPIKLKPNTAYKLTFWTAKDGAGDVRAYVAPRGGAPVLEYISGWADFFVWTQITNTFQTTTETEYTLRLIQYGAPASAIWFDHVLLEPVADAAQAPKANKPVEVYSQSYMIPFDPDKLDDTATPAGRFVIQAARNEYEPVLVAIRAGEDLNSVDLRLEGDLKSESGQTLSHRQFTIRSCENGVLPLSHPRSVQKGKHLAWWLTLAPNAGLASGRYTGKFEIVSDQKVLGQAELIVDLLDLDLPRPKVSFFLWHYTGYFRPEHATPELKRAYYKDMAEHGMTTVTIYGTPDRDGEHIDFSKDYGYLKSGTPADVDWGYDRSVPAILDAGLALDGQPIILLITKEGIDGKPGYGFGDASENIIRQILDEWFKRKWPTPLLYVHDEPSTKERIEAVKPILERIKSWNLPVKTVTAGLDIPSLGHLYDTWIQIQFDINLETIIAAREQKADLWAYDCRVPYTNAPFDRALYGFWAYRSGVQGVGRWAYHDNVKTYIDDQGMLHGGVGPRLSHVIPSSSGPVPTVAWEATREGVDDYRYLMLFGQTLAQAKDRLQEMEIEYRQQLSEDDLKQLMELDKRKHTQQKKDEATIIWTASTPRQIQGERLFYAARQLEQAIEMAKLAHKKVVDSIPADAMAVAGAVPFIGMIETLYPPLGFDDPRTVAEIKRRSLTGYLQRMHEAIEAGSQSGPKITH
jgi:hypothetical protein